MNAELRPINIIKANVHALLDSNVFDIYASEHFLLTQSIAIFESPSHTPPPPDIIGLHQWHECLISCLCSIELKKFCADIRPKITKDPMQCHGINGNEP